MKMVAVAAVIAVVGFSGDTAKADAITLTFDDTVAGGAIPNGYGGLDWTTMYVLNGTSYGGIYPTSGYTTGIVSGDYVVFNSGGGVATVSDGPFDFNSAYLTAAWNDGLSINVVGKLEGSTLYDTTVVVNTSGPTIFNFNYLGIDELVFTSFGGVDAGHGAAGTQFAMDNFTFTPVPEPTSLALLGLGGLLVARRRR